MLVAARALQGAFGALLAPAALSLLTTTFTDPEERARRSASSAPSRAPARALGLLLGGVLTEYLDWRWCLYVNLVIAIPATFAAMALLRNEVPERAADRRPRHGHGLGRPVRHRLRSGQRRDPQLDRPAHRRDARCRRAAAGRLRGDRVAHRHPLLPLHVVVDRDRGGSFLAMFLSGAGMFGVFLFLTYYMQQTLGFSPVKTGLAFLPMTATIVLSATLGSTKLLPRFGPRPLIVGGMLVAAAGMLSMTGIGVGTAYVTHVLPGLLVMGGGLGLVFSSAMATATSGSMRATPGWPRRWSTRCSRSAGRSARPC